MLSPRDLPLLPVFVAVASTGSFTAAGRDLGLAKSVVSQHVRTLEARCGVRLIERTTRRLHVTQIGEQVLEAAREVLGSVRALERVVEGHREEPSGTLRVTTPYDLGVSAVVAPVCAALLRQYRSLRVDLLFDDAVRDLVADGLDVALRLGPIVESSYVVRRLGSEPEIIVASPSVVDAAGNAEEPRGLIGAPWVAHSGTGVKTAWTFRTESGDKAQITVDLRATANSAGAVRALLVQAVGYGVLPARMVADDVRAGRLRHVCPAWFRRQLSLHALLPDRRSPPRVRVFLSALAEALKPLRLNAK